MSYMKRKCILYSQDQRCLMSNLAYIFKAEYTVMPFRISPYIFDIKYFMCLYP